MTTPSALHSAKTPKWGTPKELVELARELMGGIHLDPASSHEFNKIIQALMIYTEQDNGLSQEWAGNVFVNPPGGKIKGSRSTLPGLFWDKLMQELQAGRVERAFWVGFSVEQLCILADKEFHPLDFSVCILRNRVAYLNEETLEPGESPSHGCYVCAIGCDPAEFERLFGHLGKISHGKLS